MYTFVAYYIQDALIYDNTMDIFRAKIVNIMVKMVKIVKIY